MTPPPPRATWGVLAKYARLVALLGNEPHTPLDRAVQATLAGQGCLPGGSAGVQGVLTS